MHTVLVRICWFQTKRKGFIHEHQPKIKIVKWTATITTKKKGICANYFTKIGREQKKKGAGWQKMIPTKQKKNEKNAARNTCKEAFFRLKAGDKYIYTT